MQQVLQRAQQLDALPADVRDRALERLLREETADE